MNQWHHKKVRPATAPKKVSPMTRRWKLLAATLSAGLLLVGCSHMMARHHASAPGPAIALGDPAPLEPGVARVTVGRVGPDRATIWWKSPWKGQSTIVYGKDAHLMPVVVERSAPTAEHSTSLAELAPDTRYYLQIETATPLGVARSAVISFRTGAPGSAVTAAKPTQVKTAKR